MFAPDLLKSKRILITGGGTGLGKAMASRFLDLGATVYICGRREEVLSATSAELSPKGPIHAIPCDVRSLESVEQMLQTIWKDGLLDILVNNAAGNFIARTEKLTPNAFNAVVGIVLNGTFNCTQAFGKRWIARKVAGNILNQSPAIQPARGGCLP